MAGRIWLLDLLGRLHLHQDHFSSHAYGVISSQRRGADVLGTMDLWRYHLKVRSLAGVLRKDANFSPALHSGRAAGITFILAGSLFYTYAKSQETAKPAIALPASPVRSPRPPPSSLDTPYQHTNNFGSISSPMLRHASNQSVDMEAGESIAQNSPLLFVHAPQEDLKSKNH